MEIWLNGGGKRIQIPINPPEVSVSLDMGLTTVKIPTWGEATIVGKRGCRMVTWESFWPSKEYAFAMCKPAFSPASFRDFIINNKYNKIELTMTGTSIKALPFLVRSFVYDNIDAESDMKYTLDLVEYRVPKYTETPKKQTTTTKKEPQKVQKPATKRPAKETKKTYTVKTGDNLWNLAKSLTGSSSNRMAIYNANKTVIEKAARQHGYSSSSHNGMKGWWIFPGTKLVIPT